jgi:hypothetical protein
MVNRNSQNIGTFLYLFDLELVKSGYGPGFIKDSVHPE